MKNYLVMLVIALATLAISACGTIDDLNTISESDPVNQSIEDSIDQVESALAAPDVVKYQCYCDLSAHTCGPAFPFPVVKNSSCRYKRSANACRGRCEGRCAKQGGGIEQGSEFKGKCKARRIRPNGTPTHYEGQCDDAELDGEEALER
jgi:hypothetical protein